MNLCNKGHCEIVFNTDFCPLCQLIKHNNKVHDFIESQGQYFIDGLV